MRRLAILVAFLAVLLTAGAAEAHVTVWPKQSAVNGFERYTVRVPNEKDIPTVKVRVELPPGSTFSAVLPMPGWKLDTEKDASGKVSALVWSGGQIAKGEFLEFGASVRNPKEAGDVAWKAFQTYSDGSVVAWVGAPGSDQPAPVVTLAPAAADPGAPAAQPQPSQPAQAPATAAPQPGAARTGTWLGGAALAVSVAALLVALFKR